MPSAHDLPAHDPQGARRRETADQLRTRRLAVRFTDHEWRAVAAAAARDGRAVAAWVGELACRAAAGDRGEVPVAWADVVRELMRERAQLVALTTALQAAAPVADTADMPAAEVAAAVWALVERLDRVLDAAMSAGPW